MTETEFARACGAILDDVAQQLDALSDDVDTERSDLILTIDLDDGGKIIVNGNTPMREIWVAARSGGFHFRQVDGQWRDTRSGDALYDTLSRCLTQQAGEAIALRQP